MLVDVWIYPMATFAIAFLVILEYIVKQVYVTKIILFGQFTIINEV